MAKDAFADVSTRKHVATEEDQEHQNYPEDWENTGKLVAPGYPRNPGNSGNSGNSQTESSDEDWPHNLHISTIYVLHMEKFFSIVRQRYGLSPTDQMKNFDVNTAIWCILVSFTFQAAVHLGKDYTENLRSTKNQSKKSLRQLFHVTERLMTNIQRSLEMETNLSLLGNKSSNGDQQFEIFEEYDY